MAGDVLVVARGPEPAGTLARLVRGAGATPVLQEPVGDSAGPGPVPDVGLVLAQWPLDPADEVAVDVASARGGVGLVLVCPHEPAPGVWRDAVRLRAETVAVLPDAEPWLVARVTRLTRGVAVRAPLVGVVGGRGGAGASTLATALALTAARRDLDVTLLDLDPLGGGLDLLLGAETSSGLRWQDLRNMPGRLPGGAVRATAPLVCGVTLVGWDRTEPARVPAAAVDAVIECATDDGDLVVADLPRSLDDACRSALVAARRVLVVVPAEVGAAAAAARVVAGVERFAADIGVVVRGPAPTGLPAEAVADALGLPLAGELRPEPGLAAAVDRGDVPPVKARGPLAALSARLVTALVTP